MKEGSLRELSERIYKKGKKIPFSVMFEITQRCNLRCKFCYVGDYKNHYPDMPLKQVLHIADELKEANCMEVILLGGEPFIRKDFLKIYEYFKKQGFLITIWTNGSLITKEIMNYFKKYPPYNLRISLYSLSKEGYNRIAGNGKVWETVRKSIYSLKRNGIKFSFHSVITKLNVGEFKEMAEFVKKIGVAFSPQINITTAIGDDTTPHRFRITKEDEQILKKYPELVSLKKLKQIKERTKNGCFGCLFITNEDKMVFCPVKRKRNLDLEEISFSAAWQKRIKENFKFNCPCK